MSRRLVSTTDSILVSVAAPFASVATPITYAMWVKPTIIDPSGLGGGLTLSRKNVGGNGQFIAVFFVQGDVSSVTVTMNAAGQSAVATGALPDFTASEAWVFLGVTFEEPDVKVYAGLLNAPVAELSYIVHDPSIGNLEDVSAADLLFGGFEGIGNESFLGRLAHMSIWSGALSVAMLDHLRRFPWAPYARFSGATLLGYWPLLSSDPAPARDYSEYGNDGVFVGSVVRDTDPAFDLTGNVLG